METSVNENTYTNFDEWGYDLDYQAQAMGYADHRDYVQSNSYVHEPCIEEIMFYADAKELAEFIEQGSEEEKKAAKRELAARAVEATF